MHFGLFKVKKCCFREETLETKKTKIASPYIYFIGQHLYLKPFISFYFSPAVFDCSRSKNNSWFMAMCARLYVIRARKSLNIE